MKKILITGATGFVGGAVVSRLLKKNDSELLLLVRATSPEAGLQRIKDNLVKFGLSFNQLDLINTNNILIGDLEDAENFLSEPRLDDITHVINCAAIASFGKNPLIWKVNVEGTFKLAQRMSKVECLQRFIHVGTAMSCAPDANTMVREIHNVPPKSHHAVEYTYSKATVEDMMINDLPSLPLVIARPSIVVGHTKYGCIPSASIFWVFKMAIALKKFMCELEDRIDVVPVDYCAEALELLLTSEYVEKGIYHISAGEGSSVTFDEIDRAMAGATGCAPMSEGYQKVEYQDLVACKRTFSALFGPCNERIMLRAMNLYGHFSSLNVVFSNEKLLKLGMRPSPRFTEYLDRCEISTQGATVAELMMVDFK